MRKPAVDYRQFRLRQINEPEFKHLKLLFGWVGYFALYVLTERMISPQRCFVVHSRLDDLIPFCEWFVIPYVFWYGLVAFSLAWFLLYNVEHFKALQTYIIVTQVVAMAIYILLPTRQDLRPEMFPRDNFLTDAVGVLYRIDTNTNVCPSLHVAYSLGIASVWLREKTAKTAWKAFVVVAVVLICLSTMFIKQHSAVDVLAALPVCALAEWIAFYRKKEKPAG
ncbi:MAG: phosphatase PAP2 family protein [Oscillospiraceae bacterium]|nr:phosphatase PAP2 family protein [Oscillospiraceae bacterium]